MDEPRKRVTDCPYSFFQHLELIVHEVHQNLMLLDAPLPDDLHCALYICFDMLGEEDLPEGALAKDFEELIVSMYVLNLLVALEILETEEAPVLFFQLFGVIDGQVGVLVLLLRGPHFSSITGSAEIYFTGVTSCPPNLAAACVD